MTGRRYRITFRLQFLLVSVACICYLLAIYSYFNTVAQRQLSAVESLTTMGINALPSNSSVEFQEFTFTRSLDDPDKITLPIVSINKPSGLHRVGRRILGDSIFSDFSTIIVGQPVAKIGEIQNHLSSLPSLKTIYYYQGTMDSGLVEKLEQNNPSLIIEQLAGSPPMAAPRIAGATGKPKKNAE